jgi:hypothetical protein
MPSDMFFAPAEAKAPDVAAPLADADHAVLPY